MIKLNGILYDINALNTKAVSGMLGEDDVLEAVAELSAALDAWLAALPEDMQYTPGNLAYWADRGCGPSFVVLHINYNHSGQLLFYRFLHNSLTPPDSPISSPHTASTSTITNMDAQTSGAHAAKCNLHAAALCEIIYTSARTPRAEVRYPLVGHMLVIASTVHLYTLLFSAADAEIARARARLEHNFEIVSRLQRFWPSLHASFSRLGAFHKACLDTKGGPGGGGDGVGGGGGVGTFRLDRWMLRFLLDFAKPVDEREGGDGEDGGEGRELRSLLEG